ncbi:unnamed protein product [Vitrella brassicaformis CCMP3155]|uniref:Uncharacterized protein n=1 Tax=Vitrella brassicaformis (strain CCMP3155) TaxID=1169540 RepID=A0A0G4EL72_VITBC|nr:unnamed protein product [Vitrella brassicaformis CCMP3155]|eukprot:CEL97702.1 unnamed protein product [Vitrella brassicaformis CCMP3155]
MDEDIPEVDIDIDFAPEDAFLEAEEAFVEEEIVETSASTLLSIPAGEPVPLSLLRHRGLWPSGKKADIVSELGGTNLFLVHGEALLVHLLRSIWCRSYQSLWEIQPLVVIYQFERFLANLKECGCVFRLVFFDIFEWHFCDHLALWCLRQAVLLHCRRYQLEPLVFYDWYGEDWHRYINDWHPAFVLSGDDPYVGNPPPPNTPLTASSFPEDQPCPFLIPWGFLVACLTQGTSVALFYDIERQGRRVVAHTLPVDFGHPVLNNNLQSFLPRYVEATKRRLESGSADDEEEETAHGAGVDSLNGGGAEETAPRLLHQFFQELGQSFPSNTTEASRFRPGLRSFLAVDWLRELLGDDDDAEEATSESGQGDEDDDEEESLLTVLGQQGLRYLTAIIGKLLLLHDWLLQSMPLQMRCHSTCTKSDWRFYEDIEDTLLSTFFEATTKRLSEISSMFTAIERRQTGREAAHDHLLSAVSDVCDYFDSRLFRTTMVVIAQRVSEDTHTQDWCIDSSFFGMSGSEVSLLDWAWQMMMSVERTKRLGFSASFFPLDLRPLAKVLPLASIPSLPPPPSTAGGSQAILAMRSTFLEGFLVSNQLPGTLEIEDSALDVAEQPLFRDEDWQPEPNIVDPIYEILREDAEKEEELPEWLKKKMSKLKSDAERRQALMKFKLKREQRGKTTLHAYAKSLTGADKLHHPIVQRKEGSKPEDDDEKKKPKMSSKAKEILERTEQAQREKMKAADSVQIKEIDAAVEKLGSITDPDVFCTSLLNQTAGYYRVMDAFNDFPAITNLLKLPESQMKVLIKIAKCSCSSLHQMRPSNITTPSKRSGVRRAVCLLFRLVHDIFNAYIDVIDGKDVSTLQEILLSLGMRDSAKHLFLAWKRNKQAAAPPLKGEKDGKRQEKKGKVPKQKEKKTGKATEAHSATAATPSQSVDLDQFRVKRAKEVIHFKVPTDAEIDFQLKFMGGDLERTTGATSDKRVNFKPDAWQKRLLDIVDKNESALVCAPTASGKTFICYYAMEKVLRADSESVIAYVAPSKALVNQVDAEIYARFSSKQYPAFSKTVLSGTWTEEYHNRPLDCQVLVTVPSVLELILMSPEERKWINRLRYVIFDEVHCIGNQEQGGSSWEHLLQLIPCPFLALSATVGNPTAFYEWLTRAHTAAPVSMIVHHERYSDLLKYVYFDGNLYPLNPIACLHFRQVLTEGLPQDFYLSPPEALMFFKLLHGALEKTAPASGLWWLEPNFFFKSTRAVTKRQFRWWMSSLKREFVRLIRDNVISEEVFNGIVCRLMDPAPCRFGTTAITNEDDDTADAHQSNEEDEEYESEEEDEEEERDAPKASPAVHHNGLVGPNIDDASTNITLTRLPNILRSVERRKTYLDPQKLLGVVRSLEGFDLLPVLIFNFSRTEIHAMVAKLVTFLHKQQHDKFYGDEERTKMTKMENKRRRDKYESQLKQLEMNEKMKNVGRKQRLEQGLEGEYDETLGAGLGPPKDVAEEFDEEFSLANRKVLGMRNEDIEEQIQRVAMSSVPSFFVEGLRRGIGAHHEGLNKKYKQAVEVLFRMGYLRVVIATGSLALGINMPARSVAFSGDSLELTPLMFRQMSGRAGRRGFDALGHVIFLDFPFSKMKRLMSSTLSTLSGAFPASPSQVLRVLQLHEVLRLKDSGDFDFLKDDSGYFRTLVEKPKTLPDYLRSVDDGLVRMFTEPLFSICNNEAEAHHLLTKKEERSCAVTEWQDRIRSLVRYHFRFHMELLRRSFLVNEGGDSIGLATLMTYIFETEPGNLFLNRLLLSGRLHQLLKRVESTPAIEEEQDRTLLLVLALLFQRRTLLPSARYHANTAPEARRRSEMFSAKSPFLPPVPHPVLSEISALNDEVFSTVENCIHSSSATRSFRPEDFRLPLSTKQMGNETDSQHVSSRFSTCFGNQVIKYSARSPFMAVTGVGDAFLGIQDIICSTRSDVFIDILMIPHLRLPLGTEKGLAEDDAVLSHDYEAAARNEVLLNSWILDFYTHGKLALLRNNGLGSESWASVKSFIDILAKIKAVLTRILKKSEDPVFECVERLHNRLSQLLKAASS